MLDRDPPKKAPAQLSKDDFALALYHFALGAIAFGLLLAFFIPYREEIVGFLVAMRHGAPGLDALGDR